MRESDCKKYNGARKHVVFTRQNARPRGTARARPYVVILSMVMTAVAARPRSPALAPFVASLQYVEGELTTTGAVIEAPHLDSQGGAWIATVRDPAANAIGLYQEGRPPDEEES